MAAPDPAAESRVLVTDAGERAALATCRGLRAGGYAVSAAAFEPFAASHWSRCCSERLRLADPRIDAERFIADLRTALSRRRYRLLVPGSDFSLFAISRAREQLQDLTDVALPPHPVVCLSLDRDALATAAAQAGLQPAPSTRCADRTRALAASREIGFPLVLKSLATVSEAGRGVTHGYRTQLLASESELHAALNGFGEDFLLQRAEPGHPVSFGGVMAGGQLLAVAVSEYRRTWPPRAGNAAFSITVPADPALERAVCAMLRTLGWEGVFELELIRKPTGELVPIDLNPRPYGSMALAVRAGANLPAVWCDWLTHGSPAASGIVRARPGHCYRWEDGDMRNVLWQLRHGRYGAAVQAARPRRGVVHPHFRWRDPLPLLARALSMVRGLRTR